MDDPLLTARDVFRERPLVRVVFDRRLRTPPTARVFTTRGQGPVWILTTTTARAANPAAAAALRDAGAQILDTGVGSMRARDGTFGGPGRDVAAARGRHPACSRLRGMQV